MSGSGVQNLGNTCWFGAVISALSQFDEFRLALVRDETALNNGSGFNKLNCLTFYRELTLLLGTAAEQTTTTGSVKRCIDIFRNTISREFYGDGDQHDAFDFYNALLENIRLCFPESEAVKLFDFSQTSDRNAAVSPLWARGMGGSTNYGLQLGGRSAEETIDTISEFAVSMPEILCLSYSRADGGRTPITFPDEHANRRQRYRLESVVCALPGHYISYTREPNGTWLKRNDSVISPLPQLPSDYRYRTTVTMAFYRKLPLSVPPAAAQIPSRAPSAPPVAPQQQLGYAERAGQVLGDWVKWLSTKEQQIKADAALAATYQQEYDDFEAARRLHDEIN